MIQTGSYTRNLSVARQLQGLAIRFDGSGGLAAANMALATRSGVSLILNVRIAGQPWGVALKGTGLGIWGNIDHTGEKVKRLLNYSRPLLPHIPALLFTTPTLRLSSHPAGARIYPWRFLRLPSEPK